MKAKSAVVLSFLAFFSVQSHCLAQGTPHQGQDFFSKDFADTVLKPDQGDAIPQPHQKKEIESNRGFPMDLGTPSAAQGQQGRDDSRYRDNNKDSGQSDFFGNPTPEPKRDDAFKPRDKLSAAPEDENSIPIKAVSLVVQSSDMKKLSASIRAYGRLLRTRDIQPKRVYVVANGGDISDCLKSSSAELAGELQELNTLSLEQVKQLSKEEAESRIAKLTASPNFAKSIAAMMIFNTTFDIPKEVPVKSLPAWVLSSDKGDIVLEGIIDPTSMITMSGRFVAPLIDIGNGNPSS